MTKWSLGYQLFRYYVSSVFKLFYKRVQAKGKKNIPHGKPIIFAANHQNALMDPLAIIFTNPQQSVFLTRADIFNNPILLKIFTAFKMLPVYRIRDGADSLKNNERIFNKSVEILEAKMSVALFPEATHTDKRALRPLKKAVPRIAFQAEEENNFNLDLQIVPVGIYYEDYTHSNNNLFVNYGKPISLKKYFETYKENQAKAYNVFKKDLEDALKPLIINIEDSENYSLYEEIRLFYRARMRKKLGLKSKSPADNFKADQETIRKVEEYYSTEGNDITELKSEYQSLDGLRKKLGFANNYISAPSGFSIFAKIILLIIGLPIYIYGLINHYIYYKLSLKMIHKIKDPQFYTSFKFGIAAIIAPIIYLIHFLAFYLISGNINWALIYFISLPISALFSNKYHYWWKSFTVKFKVWKTKIANRKEFDLYENTKFDLLNKLDEITK
jgi:1-acyl-sn-glycerol-3-phosphate acyltransferase